MISAWRRTTACGGRIQTQEQLSTSIRLYMETLRTTFWVDATTDPPDVWHQQTFYNGCYAEAFSCGLQSSSILPQLKFIHTTTVEVHPYYHTWEGYLEECAVIIIDVCVCVCVCARVYVCVRARVRVTELGVWQD